MKKFLFLCLLPFCVNAQEDTSYSSKFIFVGYSFVPSETDSQRSNKSFFIGADILSKKRITISFKQEVLSKKETLELPVIIEPGSTVAATYYSNLHYTYLSSSIPVEFHIIKKPFSLNLISEFQCNFLIRREFQTNLSGVTPIIKKTHLNNNFGITLSKKIKKTLLGLEYKVNINSLYINNGPIQLRPRIALKLGYQFN